MSTDYTGSVRYELNDGIATITIDDGKRNALSPEVLAGIYQALDQAERDDAIVIITGREDVFSAGFDLKVMQRGGTRAIGMLKSGYGLPARVLRYPRPVIVACNGHSFAMGVFLMLAADCVIGSRGDYKISANEVAIGMTMPRVAAAMLKHRLRPAAYQRAIALAQYFDVDAALAAGFFDEVVEPGELHSHALQLAEQYKQLDPLAHKVSKRRIRKSLVRRLRWSRPLDLVDAAMIGFRRASSRKKNNQ
jgi:enoyl-CoA hydratase